MNGTKKNSPQKLPGIHPAGLILAYLLIGLLPLALAWLQDLPPRSFLDELATALGMCGFAMLLLEFILSGRFRLVTTRIGIDLTMWFHQLMARTLTAFILIHPIVYSTPIVPKYPWDSSGQFSLELNTLAFVSGMIAWVLLPVMVFMGIFRTQLPYRYETWRILHALAAILIAVFGLQHAIAAGRHSGQFEISLLWLVLVGLVVMSLIHVHITLPLLKKRHPYKVISVRQIAHKTWGLEIAPQQGQAMTFEAGQFVWLTLGCSPYSIREHPFSISSSPAGLPHIGFTIKEAGDFTSRMSDIAPGITAYLDGPHGHFTLHGRNGKHLVFIAGGIGIAPIMSILRQLRAENDPRPMHLIYGNRTSEQIVYAEELAALADAMSIDIHHVLSEPPPDWSGLTGHVSATLVHELLCDTAPSDTLYFVCGPPAMLDAVEHSLEQCGVPLRNIIFEKLCYS